MNELLRDIFQKQFFSSIRLKPFPRTKQKKNKKTLKKNNNCFPLSTRKTNGTATQKSVFLILAGGENPFHLIIYIKNRHSKLCKNKITVAEERCEYCA